MSELIKRQDAIDGADEIIKRDTSGNNAVVEAMKAWKAYIGNLPSAERKHGKWIQHVNEPSLWSCSICETVIYSEHEKDRLKFHKWCGCCGADMRGDTDEQIH